MTTVVYIHTFEDRSSDTPKQLCPPYQTTRIIELSLFINKIIIQQIFKLLKGEDFKVSFATVTHTMYQETETHGIHKERHEYWEDPES